VKRIIRRKIQAEKRKIARRLKSVVQVNLAGPVLSATNIHYELADKTSAVSYGGIGAVHRLVNQLGLAERLNAALHLLNVHVPYYDSDHVLNFAYNGLRGRSTMRDKQTKRAANAAADKLACPRPNHGRACVGRTALRADYAVACFRTRWLVVGLDSPHAALYVADNQFSAITSGAPRHNTNHLT
jgi:hypothetical protein